MIKSFPIQTALTIILVAGGIAAAPLAVRRLPGLHLSAIATLFEFTAEETPPSPLVARAPQSPSPTPVKTAHLPQASILLDDSNGSLDHFYEALQRSEERRPDAVTRITHYGDSPTTADLITGDIRSLLQHRFGDAGHGFILIAKPWAWYQHDGMELSASGWLPFPASRFEARDGLFGLGGVSFTSGAAHTNIRLKDPGQSQFELYYLEEPNGGSVAIEADGRMIAKVSTSAEIKAARFFAFTVPSGVVKLELRSEGNVRLFGLTAAKPDPGVVYDSLGLNGASITVLSRVFNEAHWAGQLRHRDPQLVIVNYGTNEADFAAFIQRGYETELREAIRRIRAAVPQASILVMSPMDRGHRTGIDDIETMETIPRIVDTQGRVARDTGCAFFDTFAAMGGAGTMARWYTARPRLVSADLIHPYPAGGKQIAATFVREIEAGLARYKLRRAVSYAKTIR
jgi:lysophospholipase L1-like esterase